MPFKSYIKIPRELFSSDEWASKRKFSRFEAQVDLLRSAAYANGFTVHCAMQDVVLKRGQLLTTQRDLADRWGWSPATVNRYLQTLRNTRRNSIRIRIETTIETGKTLITICDYDEWDFEVGSDETPNATGVETLHETLHETHIELNSIITENKDIIHTQVVTEEGGAGETNADPAEDAARVEARRLVEWIEVNVPTVASMDDPITEQNAVWMLRKYSVEDIQRIILAMHNKRAFENVNAYTTFGNFARRDIQLNGATATASSVPSGPRRYTYPEHLAMIDKQNGGKYRGSDFTVIREGGKPYWVLTSDIQTSEV